MFMDMTEAQRKDLAERIEAKRFSDYGGNRRRAYTAANVNAGTWTKAEAGNPLAERSYVAIVRTLWPETNGDWRQMDPPLGTAVQPSSEIAEEVRTNEILSETAKAHLLRLLAEEARADVEKRRDA